MKLLPQPIKSHIADAYADYKQTIIYDADSLDCNTNPFQVQYTIYGILENSKLSQEEKVELQQKGCKFPMLFNNNSSDGIEIGGIWIE